MPPRKARSRGSFFRQLDDAAAWVNPFLMMAAALLVILDLSVFVASEIPSARPAPHAQPSSVAKPL